ncbi:hypothetical protein INS49_004431 [Diaporthe citri]|uniref:uncharacterized protein n=1 Tax=Diaporthe citri TaxID=83186 RepID=UPI001C803C81|nr:uncharacterized protein INS49_004431 [Diaporthe citri]KAG6354414.1 hypothetical protein INS49_004431 [Diaporthe citri]
MRFSYAVVALFGAAHAMPRVGSLVTGRSVCNTEDCQGVARAVVADQAALDARKKTRQAKNNAANATAGGDANNKRSKKLFQVEARANETDVEARALGDTVDTLVGDVTGTVGDVAGGVGLKTRDGKEVRAAVTDDAAIDARQQSRQAKSAAANGTAEARSVNEERAAVTDDAAIDARQQSRQAKSAAANGTAEARSVNDNKGRSANLVHGAGADDKLAKKEATAADGAEPRKSRKSRKSRRSHQLW